MDAKTENLNVFTTRVRQLMLSYKALKEENEALRGMLDMRGCGVPKPGIREIDSGG